MERGEIKGNLTENLFGIKNFKGNGNSMMATSYLYFQFCNKCKLNWAVLLFIQAILPVSSTEIDESSTHIILDLFPSTTHSTHQQVLFSPP